MDIILKISQELMCRQEQVAAAVKLIDEGCTIPFIARYRKEAGRPEGKGHRFDRRTGHADR